jgi:chromosome segregation ATPase
MIDTEVENILREIRERVRAEQQQAAPVSPNANESGTNGATASGDSTPQATEALARIESYLTTTGRAWDRLPPVVSNRSGALARLELWIKRRLKVATRWYAWEQVNFNAAVHHALRDMLEAFSAFEQQLQRIESNTQIWAEKFEETRRELVAQRDNLKSQLTLLESQHEIIDLHRAQIESLRAEDESHARIQQAQYVELNARAQDLSERLLDEQRVCLKQLSLEISEASTLFDRARRQIEARLDDIEARKS